MVIPFPHLGTAVRHSNETLLDRTVLFVVLEGRLRENNQVCIMHPPVAPNRFLIEGHRCVIGLGTWHRCVVPPRLISLQHDADEAVSVRAALHRRSRHSGDTRPPQRATRPLSASGTILFEVLT